MFRERRILTKLDQLSPELIRESRRRYYGLISHVYYQLGRLLGELQTRGLYDNTVVLFNADHGEHLGDHRLWGKTTYLHGSADVPFVLRLPPSLKDARPGLQIDTPVLTADLHPTLLELAGLEPSPDTDAISLLPAIRDGGERKGRIVCGECGHPADANAFATDGRWKYVYYSKGGVEHLFDLATDRTNLHNLARDPRHQDIRNGLRRHLI